MTEDEALKKIVDENSYRAKREAVYEVQRARREALEERRQSINTLFERLGLAALILIGLSIAFVILSFGLDRFWW